MKNLILVLLIVISAKFYTQQKDLYYLWSGKVPGEPKEKGKPVIDTTRNDRVLRYTEITNPALEIWPADPKSNTGIAIIICPGGGYARLAYDKEGTEIAAWLNKNGISAFVLSYRIPNKRNGALQDVQRALRLVLHNAAKWILTIIKPTN